VTTTCIFPFSLPSLSSWADGRSHISPNYLKNAPLTHNNKSNFGWSPCNFDIRLPQPHTSGPAAQGAPSGSSHTKTFRLFLCNNLLKLWTLEATRMTRLGPVWLLANGRACRGIANRLNLVNYASLQSKTPTLLAACPTAGVHIICRGKTDRSNFLCRSRLIKTTTTPHTLGLNSLVAKSTKTTSSKCSTNFTNEWIWDNWPKSTA